MSGELIVKNNDSKKTLLAFLITAAVVLAVTWYCCHSTLKEVPAELIRPKAPTSGKKIFLEYLPLWNRLSFLNKVALRNIFRYRQRFLMMLIMVPMWINFLLRTYAWMSILENTGLLNNFFRSIGLLDLLGVDFIPMINTPGAVVLGMVYNYLPFMIMPIQSVIVKLDKSLVEAAQDLGCHSGLVFRKVIFPLSLPGVLSGITMVFVPCVSTFIISDLLGGGKDMLLGDLIQMQFAGTAYNPYLGSAIALVMMVIVMICQTVMNRFGEGEEQAVML